MSMFASQLRSIPPLVSLTGLLLLTACSETGSGGWMKAGSAVIGGIGGRNQDQSVDIAAGLREALRVGTETVVGQLGTTDGFNRDRAIRIPLPRRLDTMRDWMGKVGMGGSLDELETRLNRAAEAATPRAKQIFWQSIREMTLSDAKEIFNGPQDAATQFFRGKMSPRLKEEMRPVITSSLSRVGAIQKYDEIVGRYQNIPVAPKLAPDLKATLAEHTLDGALDGLFYYLAKEEAAIRQNPAKRTTELLRAVFGSSR